MGDVEDGADRPAHPVHEADRGVGEGGAAGVGGVGHRGARGQVLGLGPGAPGSPDQALDAGQREAVGDRVGEARDVGLDPVREGVDADVGGEPGGHRQGRLADRRSPRRGPGCRRGSSASRFVLGVGDHRDPGRLAAGAGGRRHGDQGSARGRDLVVAAIAAQVPGVGGATAIIFAASRTLPPPKATTRSASASSSAASPSSTLTSVGIGLHAGEGLAGDPGGGDRRREALPRRRARRNRS